MANQVASSNTDLETVIAGGLLSGENITIQNGAVVTCTQTPSVLIGAIYITEGELFIDGKNITSGNIIKFVGEAGSDIIVYGQGTLRTDGDWVSIGTTNGTSHQSIDFSSIWGSDFADVIPGIWVETGRRINYTNGVGLAPAVDDFVYLPGSKDPAGLITEVGTGYVIVKYLIGSYSDGDTISIRKVVDNYGPDFQVSWTATVVGSDVKEPGVYMEFGNCSHNGVAGIDGIHKGLGGFAFDNIYQSNVITLGGATGGWQPPSGCDIKIPNIHICSSRIAEFGSGLTYHDNTSAEGNPYNLNTTNSGDCFFNITSSGTAWFGCISAYIYEAHYLASHGEMGTASCGTRAIMHNCISAYYILAGAYWANNYSTFRAVDLVSGGEFIDCLAMKNAQVSCYPGVTTSKDVDIKNMTVVSGGKGGIVTTNSNPFRILRSSNVNVKNLILTVFEGTSIPIICSTINDVVFENIIFSATVDYTPEAAEIDAITMNTVCDNVMIKGFQVLGEGYPGNNLISIGDCSNIKIRAIGMIDEKLDFGTDAELLVALSGICDNIDIARCWKTGGYIEELLLSTNTCSNIIVQNSSGNYASELETASGSGIVFKGIHGASGNYGDYQYGVEQDLPATYGSHFHDCFRSDTTGGIFLCFTPKVASTADAYNVISGNPRLFKDGDMDMAPGDQIIFNQLYYAKGHETFTGVVTFNNSTSTTADGGDKWSGITAEFQYDTGNGFNGTWLDLRTPSNLTSITGIESGVRLQVRMTCTTVLKDINGMMIHTTTSLETQKANFYPIDQELVTFKLTGLIEGSEVRILKQGTLQELGGVETSGTEFIYNYVYTGDIPVYVVIHNNSYKYIRLETTLSNENASIPIQQQFDRNYKNEV